MRDLRTSSAQHGALLEQPPENARRAIVEGRNAVDVDDEWPSVYAGRRRAPALFEFSRRGERHSTFDGEKKFAGGVVNRKPESGGRLSRGTTPPNPQEIPDDVTTLLAFQSSHIYAL